jgi:hypothetical protein
MDSTGSLTGVRAPDFLAVIDAEDGRNRCSSACHGPDRSHLIVPGSSSSSPLTTWPQTQSICFTVTS